MKIFKTITIMFVAAMISFSAIAQTSGTATKETKTTTTKTQTKGEAKPAAKGTEPKAASDKKPADARTKTGDKINKDMKGPGGETVYTGGKGGNYYLAKDGSKKYISK